MPDTSAQKDNAERHPLLQVSDLCVAYGRVRAVNGVTFTIGAAEVVALIGANGAGKSSTLNALVGLVASSGSSRFKGDSIIGMPTEQIVRRGMTLSPEGRRVFSRMTVLENLRLGRLAAGQPGGRVAGFDPVFNLFPKLHERREQLAGTLSGGEQQMLAIGRALMCNPDLLLLDEPCLGLAPQVAERILDSIGVLKAEGRSILLVEQNVEAALDLADTALVMAGGRIVAAGSARSIAQGPALKSMIFGEAA
jgi:branched-chain amino acid transport system ATP-binding protein